MADGTPIQWRSYLMGVIIVLLAAFLIKQCRENKDDRNQFKNMLAAKDDTTRTYKNKWGEEVYTRKVVEGSLDNLKLIYTADSLKRIAAKFNTTPGKIKDYTKITSVTSTDIPLVEQGIQYIEPAESYTAKPCKEVKFMTGLFRSPYYTSTVRLGDSAYNHIEARDTLEIATKTETKGSIFNRSTFTSINLLSRNPDARYKIEGTYRVASEKKTKWAIVGYGGIGYNPLDFKGFKKPQVNVGVGIARVVVRL